MPQLSYSNDPPIGRVGMIADSRIARHVASALAVGPVAAGLGVFRVPGYGQPGTHIADPGQVYQQATPAIAVDVDAIITAYTTSTAVQTFSGSGLNGAVGAGSMYPARKFTGTLSSHANWDATNLTLIGIDRDGIQRTELIAIPDAGNATITSANYYQRIISVSIPAQSGTAGTATFGVSVLDTVDAVDFMGVATFDALVEPAASTYEYADGATIPVLKMGAIWVVTEDAVSAGQTAFVRIALSGSFVLGGIRGDADTANAVAIPNNAKFLRDSAIGALNILTLWGGV